jgi:hypothetical protein
MIKYLINYTYNIIYWLWNANIGENIAAPFFLPCRKLRAEKTPNTFQQISSCQ